MPEIEKARIIANLQARGLQARADWVDRQLPDLVDVDKNSALLQTLGIDPATLTNVDAATTEQ